MISKYQKLTKNSKIRHLNSSELLEFRQKYHFKLNFDISNDFLVEDINEKCSEKIIYLMLMCYGL